MKYAVIDATYGALALHDDEPDWDALVGPEGKDQVRLPYELGMAGWVNGCGHIHPVLPRNIVGSCLLFAMGARFQPQAGPVVLTGWDPDSDGSEICSLNLPPYSLPSLHQRVRQAIDGTDTPYTLADRQWAETIRGIARGARYAARPSLIVRTAVA